MTKSAVVTGASSGIGKATVKKLASAGYHVALLARRSMDADIAQLEKEFNVKVVGIRCDVSKREDVISAVNHLESIPEFHATRVLVNNAGCALGMEKADAADLDDWEQMINTNVKGLVTMTRLMLPLLKRAGAGATIINLGSMLGRWPCGGSNVYGATKAFVRQFSLNLRMDLHGTGIRITDVEPGSAETEFSLVRFKGDQEKARSYYAGNTPLSPEDVAHAISYVTDLPDHVCIPFFEILPTVQVMGAAPINPFVPK